MHVHTYNSYFDPCNIKKNHRKFSTFCLTVKIIQLNLNYKTSGELTIYILLRISLQHLV